MTHPGIAKLFNLITDERIPHSNFEGPQDAIVQTATATSLMFTIPDFDKQALFGPALYPRPVLHQVSLTGVTPNPHQHDPGVPPRGTHCLVVFAGNGIDRARVVAFYGWPAI